ncbi:hypothetical protein HYW41_03365 [Candidatus Daviesbacteria bacterium]|nr:hypothetical protein [Candidatus Daviesbacteria bacterium]
MERLKRILVKVGTSAIKNGSGIDQELVNDYARQIAWLRRNYGIETIIVSSGAIASGRVLEPNLTRSIIDKQVAAMFGQPELMTAWRRAFQRQDMIAGEALLKDDDLENFRYPLLRALQFGVVVINGNDVTYNQDAEEEIISADNDRLSRVVANRCGVGLLIMLTEAEGILDEDRKVISNIASYSDLHRISFFERTQEGIGGPGSKLLEARKFITDATKIAYIAGARMENVILRIATGERVGTRVTLPLQGFLNI